MGAGPSCLLTRAERGDQAAVDQQVDAVDETGLIGRQERGQGGRLGGHAETAERGLGDQAVRRRVGRSVLVRASALRAG